ncbi:MAG TPA: ABC transporter permease [Chitinophagaceae bacterium]|jgi:putative ABC transport system permease protein|nr:ABC transporter permease [Chitinophagaceae bacterium]
MFRIIEILSSSLKMALEEFRSNKLRTFLSLFGITIGIFCIIGVLATVNSLERNVQNDINSLGTNSIYIDKWEYGPSNEWWKLMKRPPMKYDEMKMLKQKVNSAEHMAFKIDARDKVEYEDNVVTGVSYLGTSDEFPNIQKIEITQGRYFQQSDHDQAANSIVIGYNVAEQLFSSPENALGKQIEIKGKIGNVVGLIKKQGQSMVDMWGFDDCIMMPYSFLKTMIREQNGNPVIIVQGRDNVPVAQLKDELSAAMRSIRKLKPTEEDNYSLNDIEPLKQMTEGLFSGINMGGWAIAGLSLIVGMFGVANIMFVTVRERTSQIGLKKAIGAKRSTILMEFLMESAFLCILGGAIGILLVFILTKVFSALFDFPIFISVGIMGLAVSICIIIGILAGIIPASIAARMDPVVAIRTK